MSFFDTPGNRDSRARIATARAGNVIGGGDWVADRLIPDAMRADEGDLHIRIAPASASDCARRAGGGA